MGTLAFEAKGARRSAAFACADSWLENPDRFVLSPDLPLVAGHQFRANKDLNQSAFFGCFADVEPDGWGRMVIKRDHAKQRKESGSDRLAVGLLNDFDFLLWVNNFSRMGAIRFRDEKGVFQGYAFHCAWRSLGPSTCSRCGDPCGKWQGRGF